MSREAAVRTISDPKIDDRVARVLDAVRDLTAELGRGPTGSEIAAHLADGKGDVRAELGMLLGVGLVACRGLADTVPAACWVLTSE